jgi:hypothetical protein
MILLRRTLSRRRDLPMLAAGLAAGTVLTSLGIPAVLNLLVSALAAAYAQGWRLSFQRGGD